jgi:phage virion morphogenesis protein
MPKVSLFTTVGPSLFGKFRRAQTALSARDSSFDPESRQVARHLVAQIIDRMKREVTPEGKPWVGSRLKKENRKGRFKDTRHKLLFITGALRSSVAVRVDPGSETRSAWEIYGDKSVVPYARVHHYGYKAPGASGEGIPARPYLGANEGDKDYIRRLYTKKIIEALKDIK